MAAITTSKKSKRSTKKNGNQTAKRTATTIAASGRSKAPATKSAKSPATTIVNYSTALRWLYEHVDYERMRIVPYNTRTFSLERMRRLLAGLDNPDQQLKCVQVAGTKGKGSTCAMLSSMLQECGYTVGLFTSPHLIDICERITINGQLIRRVELSDLFKLIATKEKALGDNRPTFFEILTATALRYFADQAVDIVVLETGLGGRLDSTSVVTPVVTGMTQISLDHMNILGSDVKSIAREKAGVFKRGVDAVSVVQEPQVARVLDDSAAHAETVLEYTGRDIEFSYRFEATRPLGPHTRVCITTRTSRWDHLRVPLAGEHQAQNCGLALAMLDKLKGHGFNILEQKVIEGLAKTTLAGRMEKVWKDPRVYIDGAHNAASITALIRALGAHVNYDSLVLIFGCGQDKDVSGMLRQISLGADKVIFTRAKANPRAYLPEDLMTQFAEISVKMAQSAPTLPEALKLAGRAVSREDVIVVTGSFYLVGEAKKYFLEKNNKRKPQSSRPVRTKLIPSG